MLYGILLSMEKDSRRDLFQTNHSEAVSSLSGRPERNITVMNKTIPEIIHRRVPTTRYEADPSEGLSAEQVAEYRENGWTNRAVEPPSKTTAEIVKSNVCTYFNLIFLIIAIFLILAGSFRDLTFLPVIIANTLIGIVQEIKAKKTLEKLSVLNAPKATAIRDGAEVTLAAEDLVLDDIVVFTAGKQICADAVVLEGEVQVNESLLTGESDEITKRPGDELMSGSFIVSGSCKSRLTQVGEDSYISRLTLEAKAMKEGEQSEMIRSLNKLVKVVGILIIPIGLLLFGQQFFVSHETFRESITSMVAAVLGMIPEGLYLLASVALAVSVMRLASQKVLVHDMKCIETLARVNVLCVDKTGTITETNMKVHDLILVGSSSVPDTESGENAPAPQKEELSLAVGDFASAMSNDNITMAALKEYFKDNNGRTAVSMTSFSSEFKYSSVTFSDVSYVLGAPEFVLRDDFARYQSEIEAYTSKGFRLLVFGTSETVPDGKALSSRVTPLGYVLLSNPIRKEAPETFRYFEDQGVHVKVISGDTPVTVSEVARQAGIAHAEDYIDASTLKTPEELEEAILKYTVFGRVTPDQKRQFVQALKKNGKTVAMTGDGVNDVLALKDADCSVAMASGSDAAAQAAQLVLLDNDFSKMPFCRTGRPPRCQQPAALGNAVPGKEHFLVPAVHLLTDLDGDVSAGAVPDLADQYVYDRYSRLPALANAEQKPDRGPLYHEHSDTGPACGADRLFDGRNTRRLRPGICGRLGRYFDRCHRTARHCRFYDSLPDQQAAQLDALDDPDRLDYCLHFLQYLSEPAVRHF